MNAESIQAAARPAHRFETLSSHRDMGFEEAWYEIATESHFWFDWRLKVFLRQLRDLGVETQSSWLGLDIGSGHGLLRRQLERTTAWTLDAADLNREALSQNVTRRGRRLYYDIHDRREDLRGKYDFIVLFDVLEHVEDPEAFLRSSLHHLADGGWVFTNVPAVGRFLSDFDRAIGHLRRYDSSMMSTELRRAGLRVCDSRYWGLSMLPLLIARWKLGGRGAAPEEIIRRGLQPPARWMAGVLRRVMQFELRVSPRPSLGTSLLTAARPLSTSRAARTSSSC